MIPLRRSDMFHPCGRHRSSDVMFGAGAATLYSHKFFMTAVPLRSVAASLPKRQTNSYQTSNKLTSMKESNDLISGLCPAPGAFNAGGFNTDAFTVILPLHRFAACARNTSYRNTSGKKKPQKPQRTVRTPRPKKVKRYEAET